ncbi:uncharacterized protein LTHEOB_668 [Lasiodiplodia theobromae]|uniref:uncharacterized protein n=1 Tax=Lasiodiplodia theobromae TaxID=45133 RepID=UPI0015C2EDEE|nr:uncharacterized protein LTHEOB_668 [Lasiodiplodia theobromae]KAF4540726.1 hypothetical protein LTHEOB_668 [Lasiodiplodia theobromae]
MKPSLPIPSPSLSFWHRTTRAFPHLNANCQANVPASVKFLIIGSGIAGSLTAWKLIESGVKGEDIVILEAREAVSGATGRNAGHIRPDAFRGFPVFSAIHGPEQARKILENEIVVLEEVKKFVEANNIACDFNYTSTYDVCLSQEFADHQAKGIAQYKAAGGDVSHVKYYEGDEAKAKTRIPTALSAYEWPAASNHPAKLCQWILNDAISKGCRLWTHCPATKVVKHQGPAETGLRWDVHTPRGIISAKTVIHCTNAYAAALLPELADFVTPRQAQAQSFVPTPSISGGSIFNHTMSLRYGLHCFFSFHQRQTDGMIIFGGTGSRDPKTPFDQITFDDSRFSDEIFRNSAKEFSDMARSPTLRHGEGFDHSWTGIIAMTPDSVPLVGPVEGCEGQWICAGFNGHGEY